MFLNHRSRSHYFSAVYVSVLALCAVLLLHLVNAHVNPQVNGRVNRHRPLHLNPPSNPISPDRQANSFIPPQRGLPDRREGGGSL